jgi:hypothetical protein
MFTARRMIKRTALTDEVQSMGFARASTRQADDDFSDQLLCSILGQAKD